MKKAVQECLKMRRGRLKEEWDHPKWDSDPRRVKWDRP